MELVSILERLPPAPASLLRLMALLAPEPLPVALLVEWEGDLEELERHGLVSIQDSEVMVPPEVREAARSQLEPPSDPRAWEVWEPLIRRALALDEAAFGSCHPQVAIHLSNLGLVLLEMDLLSEAEPLMRRALAIDEAALGCDHPNVAVDLCNLARLLQVADRLPEAEPLMRRALAVDEACFGRDHPSVARDLNNLAQILQDAGRPHEAEFLMREAVEAFNRILGPDHPSTRGARKNLELLLEELGYRHNW